jgi:phage repressor protein C with HTH and peptisase S24 domain
MNAAQIDMLRFCLVESGAWPVQVNGWCMKPLIDNGAELMLETVKPEALQTGDVVVYLRQGQLLAHRLIGRDNGIFILRPDNRLDREDRITADDIVGRVREIKNPSWFKKTVRKAGRLFTREKA